MALENTIYTYYILYILNKREATIFNRRNYICAMIQFYVIFSANNFDAVLGAQVIALSYKLDKSIE